MNKKLFGLAIGMFVLVIALAGFASAQYYYGGYYGGYNNNFNSYSYSSARNNNGFIRATNYDRVTNSAWIGGQYVTTTSYIKTTAETPRYGYGYNSYYYQNSYNPWYQKYWNQPHYSQGYGYPRNVYGYGY